MIHPDKMAFRDSSHHILFSKLRNTKLKGHNQAQVYKDSHMSLVDFHGEDLVPPQNYLLAGQLSKIKDLRFAAGYHGIDLFGLQGYVTIDGIPFLPPIVEVSATREGRQVLIICDGMHRVACAMAANKPITCVLVSNLPPEYPYYAWPLKNGWRDVERVANQPIVKKEYREADYKALYRNFEAEFPGYQPSRDKYATIRTL